MRKILVFFTIIFLTVGIVACSNDDDTTTPTTEKRLFLKINKDVINENETVLFTAFDDKNKEVEAEFYINGVKVTNKHKFEKKGIYLVIAKKAGYADTAPLSVEVVKHGDVIIKKLVLSVDKAEVEVGEKVVFTVTDGENIIDDATIYMVDFEKNATIEWEPNKPGTATFVASKLGYYNSNSVIVKSFIEQKPVKDKANFTIDNIKYNAELVQLVVKGDPTTTQPFLFKDGDLYYFIYMMYFYEKNRRNGISYSMKVYVPKETTTLVLPYEVDKSKIELMEIVTYLSSATYQRIPVKDFTIDKMEWEKVAAGVIPSKVTTKMESRDKKVAIDYDGKFEQLFIEKQSTRKNLDQLDFTKASMNFKSVKIVKK